MKRDVECERHVDRQLNRNEIWLRVVIQPVASKNNELFFRLFVARQAKI